MEREEKKTVDDRRDRVCFHSKATLNDVEEEKKRVESK